MEIEEIRAYGGSIITKMTKQVLKYKRERMIKRKDALRFFIEELSQSWEDLVEEAKRDLDTEDENYIIYRYALLLFALNRAPNSDSRFAKPFKELIRCYLE